MRRTAQAICALVFVLLLMGGAGVAVMLERVPDVGYLTRDATSLTGVPWWTGAISRFTGLCWAVAATVNLIAANSLAAGAALPKLRRSLLLLGVLCIMLALDDTMLVHDAILRVRGVPEEALFATYALACLVLAWWFRASWRTAVGAAFFTGAAMLAVSMVLDSVYALLSLSKNILFLVEDGSKLAGVLAWSLCGLWAYSDRVSEISRNAFAEAP